MIRSKLKHLLALGVFAFALRGTANAQWTTNGPSPLGGTIFLGSGNTGPLSTTTTPALTLGGGDTITLNVGGFATGSGVDTIIISGPNNLLTNYGVIQGAAGITTTAFNAIDLNNSNQTIVNNGNIFGGAGYADTGAGGGAGGYGIYGNTTGDLDSITITNHSGIYGGGGGAGAGNGGGDGSYAIYMDAGGAINNFTLTNTSGIFGGSGGNDPTYYGGGGADAVYLYGSNGLNNTIISNSGIIQGGMGGSASYATTAASGGFGLDLESGENLSGLTLNNTGLIIGGAGGANNSTSDSGEGGAGGTGLYVYADTFINNVLLNNSGTIAGGAGGSAAAGGSGGGYGLGGYGIEIYADDGTVSGLTLNNSGSVLGGAGGAAGYYVSPGGTSVYVYGYSGISGVTINNSGIIAGGAAGSSTYQYGYGYYGGGAGIYLYSDDGPISGLTVNNSGQITGGVGGTSSGYYGQYGGYALELYADTTLSNVSITNSGLIQGGNGGFAGYGSEPYYAYGYYGYGGYGIYAEGDGGINGFTINNSGTIAGGNGAPGGNYYYIGNQGGYAVELYSDAGASNISITNSGLIQGGNGGDATDIDYTYESAAYTYGFGGYGVYLYADGNVSNVTLNNTGSITGGNGGNQIEPYSDYDLYGSAGGAGVYLSATNGSVSNVTINNTGLIQGGNGGSVSDTYDNGDYDYSAYAGGDGGAGIFVSSTTSTVSGVSIYNSPTGVITGGNGGASEYYNGDEYGLGANAVDIEGYAGISGVTINNAGLIQGGNGGNAFEPVDEEYVYGGYAGNGIYLYSDGGPLSNVTINNAGSILGGNGGSAMSPSYPYYGYTGGAGGAGIYVYADTSITGLGIYNAPTGIIAGGNGGASTYYNYDGYGGDGIYIEAAGGTLSGVSITNAGSILGGNGGAATGVDSDVGGSGGNGIEVYGDSTTGLTINNAPTGVIAGGNGGSGTYNSDYSYGNGGAGIYLGEVLQATITNYGVIRGGNGGAASPGYTGYAGYGIYSQGNGLTINNYGSISAGGGQSTAATAGFPAVAVYVDGNNNTINLKGHSSVNGTLEGAGSNNVLNLDFTGVSPQAIAALKAQLAAEGYPATNNFTGSFTLRGVTYYVDPLILNLSLSSYEMQGLTPNEYAIGVSLDSATVNPAPGSSLANLFNAIDASGNVPGALEALSPQQYQAYGDLAIANTTAIVQNVDARLNNIRDGSESIDTTGVGGTSDATTTAGYSKDDGKESKNIVQTAPPEKRWGFFATGDGLFFRGGNHGGDLQDDRADSAGTLAGVDAKIGEHFIAGALFSYNNTDATLGSNGNSGHATIESYTGGLYGSYHQDGFYVNSLAAYTRNHYESDRSIVLPGFGADASANANGNQASANIDGGYDWHATDRLTLGPLAGLQYVHLDVNGFNEIGAGAADLAVNSQSMDSLQSRVGGKINYHVLTGKYSSFAADLHAAWQHEYLDDSRGISASFIGDGLTPFSVQTTSPLRDAAVVGLGLNFTFHDRLTLFADYELLMWRASSFEQTINGGARISF